MAFTAHAPFRVHLCTRGKVSLGKGMRRRRRGSRVLAGCLGKFEAAALVSSRAQQLYLMRSCEAFDGEPSQISTRRSGWPHHTLQRKPRVRTASNKRCCLPSRPFVSRAFREPCRVSRAVILDSGGQVSGLVVEGGSRRLLPHCHRTPLPRSPSVPGPAPKGRGPPGPPPSSIISSLSHGFTLSAPPSSYHLSCPPARASR